MQKLDIATILKWSERHSYVVLFSIGLYALSGELAPMVFLPFLSFMVYIYQHRSYLLRMKPLGGHANRITFLRLLIFCGTTLLSSYLSYTALFLLFGIAVLMDVLDGYLARKFDQMSDFGLYLDMESDALFVALIATVLYEKGLIANWILFPAYLRYFYMLFLKFLTFPIKKEPKRAYASIIAGCFFVSLLLPLILPKAIYNWPLGICGALIIFSFSVSTYFQIFGKEPESIVVGKKIRI
ncbi:MAG: CDP-alcohol phosphatidyltransferase family protein [Bacteroidota bacterium]